MRKHHAIVYLMQTRLFNAERSCVTDIFLLCRSRFLPLGVIATGERSNLLYPVASSKKVFEMSFVASRKNVSETTLVFLVIG